MRIEFRIGLALNAIGLIFSRFTFFTANISSFLCGMSMSLGVFFMIINLLSEKTYNNLFYRELLNH